MNTRGFLKHAAICAGAAALVGGLVLLSGVAPITASSGHWPVTRFILNLGKERSVSTHTLGMNAPDLGKPGGAARAAVHFDLACRFCHGNPGYRTAPLAQAMTPEPPYLPRTVAGYDDAALFYIVKHGIKFTGMPAWPAVHRDDEIWAMVAFLRTLPDMTADQYALVTRQDLAGSLVGECARCHGADGSGSAGGLIPALAGQHEAYLAASLRAYAAGQRHSGIMQPVAARLETEEIDRLARHYARMPAPKGTGPADASALRGKTVAHEGIPDENIPACVDCHGPDASRGRAGYPRLVGQSADYLALQLELFQKHHRGGTRYVDLMHEVVDRMSQDDMRDVAAFYASQ